MSTAACLVLPGPKCAATGSPALNFNTTTPATPATPATPFIPGNLFPFYLGSSSQYTNDYQVWAGSCEQEQPLQPPAGTGFASVTPGKVASATPEVLVDEPAIDVAVTYNGGTAVPPTYVTITFKGTNSSGTTSCVDVWHNVAAVAPDTVAGNYGIYPAPFFSNAPKGSPMASATGDQGSIQVCAYYNGYHATTTPTQPVSNFNAPNPVPVMDVYKGGTSGPCP
jgi:hypothetical protein